MLRKIFRAPSIIIAISLLVTTADAGEEARLFEEGRQELQAKEFSRAIRSPGRRVAPRDGRLEPSKTGAQEGIAPAMSINGLHNIDLPERGEPCIQTG